MTDLVVADRNGRVVPRPTFKRNRQAPKPIIGDAFGAWAGRDISYLQMPGGSVLAFDLSRLTLQDFRGMREHYQLQASLSVLTFILHQIDWEIECDNKEIKDQIEANLHDIWTTLIRGMSQAFWAGYAPNVIEWENDPDSGYIVAAKIKDLVPEECRVHWAQVEGWAPPGGIAPKFNVYDGIDQFAFGSQVGTNETGLSRSAGYSRTIPPENSLWYPLTMENGDYYGKKLLRPAFPSWFFSTLIHLFANRYFERFGEPTPVGRAPLTDEVDMGGGNYVNGKAAMESILTSLRNRSVVVLPSDRDPLTKEFEWSVEYLESQMRGADFERYLNRLDEEMSLAVFTPVLLFRTADVGSYNLGEMHLRVFMWMLNSLAGDMKYYIEKYVVDRLRVFNWGENAPRARWVYRKLGKDDSVILQQILGAMIQAGMAQPDLDELGTAIGLTLHKVEQVTAPPAPPTDPTKPKPTPKPAPTTKAGLPRQALDRLDEAVARLCSQVGNGSAGTLALGYKRAFIEASGLPDPVVDQVYGAVNGWLKDVHGVITDEHRFGELLGNIVDGAIEETLGA